MELPEEHFRNYKEFHEHFMLNHNGTSLLESALTIAPPPSSLIVWSVVLPVFRCVCSKKQSKTLVFIVEFLLLIIPLVLSFTILSNYIHLVTAFLLLTFIGLVIYQLKFDWNLCFRSEWYSMPTSCHHRPFITLFRCYTNVITCLCILAVDFRVFPRSLAKTEVGGYGLMDTGTGLFVVGNALVSCKNLGKTNAFDVKKEIISSSPLLVLGFVRLIVTQLLSYQEHVSEYGTHWNFFFTLSAARLLSVILLSTFGGNLRAVVIIFLLLGFGHEFALSVLGLREWVLSDQTERLNFISSNREGIVSLVGYVCLHFGGILIFARYTSKPRKKVVHSISFWKELSALALILWGITHVFHECIGVSRRVADLGYIFWILAYATTSLTSLLTVELFISAAYCCKVSRSLQQNSKSKLEKYLTETSDERDELSRCVPLIFQAVNYNGLAYFLVANVMTGIVNLSLQTLNAGGVLSMVVIITYMFILCLFVLILYSKKIKLKAWYVVIVIIGDISTGWKVMYLVIILGMFSPLIKLIGLISNSN